MVIGLNDLDATVVTAFGESVQDVSLAMASPFAIRKEFAENRTEEQKRLLTVMSKHRWLGGGAASFLPVGAAFASVMIGAQVGNHPVLMASLFGLSFLCSGASLWNTFRRDLMVGFRTRLPSEVLLAALPLMNLSPAEHLYGETVGLLMALQEKVDVQTTRNILLRLNEMLANHRQLEMQSLRLTSAVGQHSVAALETDRAGFVQRLSRTDDAVTRQALQQSLQMCEARLQDARTMEQNLQRVQAQQEAIQQTLASAQSALLRMQTSPDLASPAVEELTQAVTEINLQTQAVEQAVQEVATLSAQS